MTDRPSLLAFILARLDDDSTRVILNTPHRFENQLDPEFHDWFVSRGALLHRLDGDREIVARCVAEMQNEQDAAFLEVEPGGATILGSEVLKLIAWRYYEHTD